MHRSGYQQATPMCAGAGMRAYAFAPLLRPHGAGECYCRQVLSRLNSQCAFIHAHAETHSSCVTAAVGRAADMANGLEMFSIFVAVFENSIF